MGRKEPALLTCAPGSADASVTRSPRTRVRRRRARPIHAAELRPVRIRITDPSLLEELGAHYARSGFVVRAAGARELEVERPDAPTDEQGRREVAAHLLVWGLLHPESPGELTD